MQLGPEHLDYWRTQCCHYDCNTKMAPVRCYHLCLFANLFHYELNRHVVQYYRVLSLRFKRVSFRGQQKLVAEANTNIHFAVLRKPTSPYARERLLNAICIQNDVSWCLSAVPINKGKRRARLLFFRAI